MGIAQPVVAGGAQGLAPPQTAIDGVIAANAKVELIKDGFKGAEGPVAAPDGTLYFSDINANRTYKLDRNGDVTVWRENTGGGNGLFLANDGRLLVAEQAAKRIVAILPDGRVVPLVTEFDGKPLRAPNDLIMDEKGGIYFTEPSRGLAPEPSHVLYRRAGGEIILLDDQISFPNGISLSPDEKTLYVVDSQGEDVYAFDVQPDGSVRNKRSFVKLREATQSARGPSAGADSMAIDSKGRLYVPSSSGVQVISPRGEYLGTIRVPTKVRNAAFGGPNRQTLYMTAPGELYRVQLLSEGPADRSK